MNVVPFKAEHFDDMDLRHFDKKSIEGLMGIRDYIKACSELGQAFTGIADEGVVGSGGLIPLWPGVAEAWTMTSPLIEKYVISFHRAVRKHLNLLEQEQGLHRIQCVIIEGHDISTLWVERLGFKYEGIMEAYGPNKENYYRYARTNHRSL